MGVMVFKRSGLLSFPGGSDGKESARNAGDPGSVPGYPLQYSCLEKSMGGEAWWAMYSPWGHK